MSTRSRIGIVREDSRITSIYCHFDGYLEGVGKVLKEHYRDPKKVEELISLGDISFLGEEPLSSPDIWANIIPSEDKDKYTGAYRDREGEDPEYIKPRNSKTKGDFLSLAADSCADYVYLYHPKANDWEVFDYYGRNLGWLSKIEIKKG